MTPTDIIHTAEGMCGLLAVFGGGFAAWTTYWPNRITARTAAKQQQDDEDRNRRAEMRRERDEAVTDAQEARREAMHWREALYSLRDATVAQQATCRSLGIKCGQTFEPIHIEPYGPAKHQDPPK